MSLLLTELKIFCTDKPVGNEAILILMKRYHKKFYFSTKYKLYKLNLKHIEENDIIHDVTIELLEDELPIRSHDFFDDNLNVRNDYLKILYGRIRHKTVDYYRKNKHGETYEEVVKNDLESLMDELDVSQIDSRIYQLPELSFLDKQQQSNINHLHPLIKIAILKLHHGKKFKKNEYKICCYYYLDYKHQDILKLLEPEKFDSRELTVVIFRINRWIKIEILKILKLMKENKKELL